MKTKHTKGEWVKRQGDSECKFDILGEFGTNKTIAIIPNKCFVSDEEAEANAKLIASASELLDALKMIRKELKYGNYKGNHVNGMIQVAEEAISKAILSMP